MAQVTIRNLDAGTWSSLKRRAAAEGRSVSAVGRDILSAATRWSSAASARARFPGAMRTDAATRAALAKMEQVWEHWESEPRVEGCSSEVIREGREERMAAIEGRMGAERREE